ncbi:MAG: hypothetical protein VW405_00910 [Rhodospirillaceae bacterium]
MLKLKLPWRGKGQHIAFFESPAARNLPDLLTGDKAWVRRHERLANTDLMVVECWGESASIVDDVLTVHAPTEPDVPFVLSPWVASAVMYIGVNDEMLQIGQPKVKTFGSHAMEMSCVLTDAAYSGMLRLLYFARHPIVYASLSLKRAAAGPAHLPVRAVVATQNGQTWTGDGSLIDCKCRFDFAIQPSQKVTDQELVRAVGNAGTLPLSAAVVPVEP